MPRNSRANLYKNEREEISKKVLDILDLDEDNSLLFTEMDDDIERQNMLTELLRENKHYYSVNEIPVLSQKDRIKRQWLSITKSLLKMGGYKVMTATTTKNSKYDRKVIISNKKLS